MSKLFIGYFERRIGDTGTKLRWTVIGKVLATINNSFTMLVTLFPEDTYSSHSPSIRQKSFRIVDTDTLRVFYGYRDIPENIKFVFTIQTEFH